MEEHYLALIWKAFRASNNESISDREIQDKIRGILSLMKKDVHEATKSEFKKQCIKQVSDLLNSL